MARSSARLTRDIFFVLAALTLTACSSSSHSVPTVSAVRSAGGTVVSQSLLQSKIKHVIVVILENRSFDNMMQFYDHSKADIASISGTARDQNGNPVTLRPETLTASMTGTGHSHPDFISDYNNGRNNGWPSFAYAYAPQVEVQPYLDIANGGAISDRFFHGVTAPTFPSHLEIGGAETYGVIDNPSTNTWGCDSPPGTTVKTFNPAIPGEENPTGPFPCFEELSIFDLLDRAQPAPVTWRYYDEPQGYSAVGNLNIAGYFRHIRNGPDWNTNIAKSDAEFLPAVSAGTLPQVSFLIPNESSTDGAGTPSLGPTYIKNVVNAFGASRYYNDSLMIVTWDDWGGWYDHVVPPTRADGSHLSWRKPIIFVGGYVKHGYVSHVQTEDASIAKTIETIFNLGTLGAHDVQTSDFSDVLDIAQTPPPFAPITSNQGLYTAPGAPPGIPPVTRPVQPFEAFASSPAASRGKRRMEKRFLQTTTITASDRRTTDARMDGKARVARGIDRGRTRDRRLRRERGALARAAGRHGDAAHLADASPPERDVSRASHDG